MRVLKWIAGFVRFINRNPLLTKEIEACNENKKRNGRYACRERRMSSR